MNNGLKLFMYSIPFILLDFIAKLLSKNKIIIINDLFGVTYTTNTGASFSLFQGYNFLLMIITIALVLSMFIYFKKFKSYGFFGVVLITAGGIGNLIDRLLYGYIQDFIYIKFWPTVFNFADIFLTFGVILLIIYWIKNKY